MNQQGVRKPKRGGILEDKGSDHKEQTKIAMK